MAITMLLALFQIPCQDQGPGFGQHENYLDKFMSACFLLALLPSNIEGFNRIPKKFSGSFLTMHF